MLYWCEVCKTVYMVTGDKAELTANLTKGPYPCVTLGCGGTCRAVDWDKVVELQCMVETVPFKNFYRAINGFGLPRGMAVTLEAATKIFQEDRVVKVVGTSVGQPERVILQELRFASGAVMHFAASSKGACLYYIETPGPSCREVVESHE